MEDYKFLSPQTQFLLMTILGVRVLSYSLINTELFQGQALCSQSRQMGICMLAFRVEFRQD